jgi:cystathionine beta-lyase
MMQTGKSFTMQETTQLIHSIPVDPLTGAIAVPIYQTSTFVQEAPGLTKGYDYARTGNPTRAVLENLIATLENGSTGIAFGSGLAAIDAVLKLLQPGDEILAVDDIYGGAYRLFEQVYRKWGLEINYVDTGNSGKLLDALTRRTKLIWLETPTNPTLKVSDISTIAGIAHARGSLLCVDNTFASPAVQKPLDLGADIVIHSATKYLAGHSDLIAGLVVTRDGQLGERIRWHQNACGAILGPFDSWLLIRGIETLHLRIRQHCENAQRIAEYLNGHPLIRTVYYPGLASHANHAVSARQSKGAGGIVSFTLIDNTQDAAHAFIKGTRLFKLAESLGGIKSLLSHPASMTHKSIPPDTRRAAGVEDSLIRLSVGLEDAEDLISDLQHAFAGLQRKYVHPKAKTVTG